MVGSFDRRGRRRIGRREEEARVHEEPAAQRAGFLDPELVVPGVGGVRALGRVVEADALVPQQVAVAVEPDAEHLVLGQGIVHVGVDVDELARHANEHRLGADARGQRRVDVGRLEGRGPVEVQVVAEPVLDQGAAEEELIVLRAFGSTDRRERAAPAHRSVAQPHLRAAAQRPQSRLGDDVDEDAAGGVELRGEGVARDANRADLRLGRQLGAFEAVDADYRVAADHLGQLAAHLLRIVGQRVDLLACQRRAESPLGIGGRGLRVLGHGDACPPASAAPAPPTADSRRAGPARPGRGLSRTPGTRLRSCTALRAGWRTRPRPAPRRPRVGSRPEPPRHPGGSPGRWPLAGWRPSDRPPSPRAGRCARPAPGPASPRRQAPP